MYEVKGDETLFIVAMYFFENTPNLVCHVLYVDGERPAYKGNSPILFFDSADAPLALAAADCGAEKLILPAQAQEDVREHDFTLAIREILSAQQYFSPGSRGMIVDCLNLLEDHFFDTMSDEARKSNPFFTKIFAASLYFFEHDDVSPFFEQHERKDLIDAITYTIGQILISATYVG